MSSPSNRILLACGATVVLTLGLGGQALAQVDLNRGAQATLTRGATSSNAFRSATASAANLLRGSHPNHLAEELNHGRRLHHHHLWVFPAHLGLRAPLREGLTMTPLLIVGGVLAALLLIYLGFALLYPEKLS